RDEPFRDLKIDIGFEQCQSNLTQRVVDVGLADLSMPTPVLENVLEPVAELRKHDVSPVGNARASRAGDRAIAIANFSGKVVLARRQNQHARARALPRISSLTFSSASTLPPERPGLPRTHRCRKSSVSRLSCRRISRSESRC